MKKIMCSFLILLLMCSLTGCADDLDHYTNKESEALMEEVLGCDVTYVSTDKYPKEKKVLHMFRDESGMEFAVISCLRQGWFQVGLYRCKITDNYLTAKLQLHKQEIMEILEKYGLVQNLRNTAKYYEDDIALGEGINPDVLYLEYPMGDIEETLKVLEDVAAAGAEIDALLSLSYDKDYDITVQLPGGDFESFVSSTGINIKFSREEIGYDGQPYEALDITFFEWSMSEEERWTEEELYEHLKSKLTKALGSEEE